MNNLDSLRSVPEFTLPLTARQMEQQIAHLHAKVRLLEIQVQKLTISNAGKNWVREYLSRRLAKSEPEE